MNRTVQIMMKIEVFDCCKVFVVDAFVFDAFLFDAFELDCCKFFVFNAFTSTNDQ